MLTHHILCFFVILPPLVAHFQNLFISCPTDIARMDSDIARVRVCGVDTRAAAFANYKEFHKVVAT